MRFRLALAGLLGGALAGLPLVAANLDVGGGGVTSTQRLTPPGPILSLPPTLIRAQRQGSLEKAVDPAFYAVVACVLLAPWALLGLTLVGHLHAQWARKAVSIGALRGREMRHLAPRDGRGNPWPVP